MASRKLLLAPEFSNPLQVGFDAAPDRTHDFLIALCPFGADSNDVDQSFRSDADQFGAKRRRAFSV
jgi:hypothetical protein